MEVKDEDRNSINEEYAIRTDKQLTCHVLNSNTYHQLHPGMFSCFFWFWS
jgi:hypothetical protein